MFYIPSFIFTSVITYISLNRQWNIDRIFRVLVYAMHSLVSLLCINTVLLLMEYS